MDGKIIADEVIAHWGIRGMKWGVRRQNRSLDKGASDDAKQAHRVMVKAKTGGIKALSNNEIKVLNARLNLERSYSQLTYEPSRREKGFKILSTILQSGKKAKEAYDFVETVAGHKQKKALETMKLKTATANAAEAAKRAGVK